MTNYRSSRRRWVYYVSLVLIVAGCSPLKIDTKAMPGGTSVTVQKPVRGEFKEVIHVQGEVQPKKIVGISARVSARIAEMPVLEGSVVKGPRDGSPGSLLVRLDSKDLEAALSSAKAEVEAQKVRIEMAKIQIEQQKKSILHAKIGYEQNKKDLARAKALFQSGDKSRNELESLQVRFDQMTNEIESAELTLQTQRMNFTIMQHNLRKVEAAMATAEENLGYTTIRSPIDGVITQQKAHVGEIAMQGTMNNAGTMLLEVADLSNVWFMAEIPERYIGKLAVGMTASVRLSAYKDREFVGRIESLGLKLMGSQQQEGGQYFQAKITLTSREFPLRPGLHGDAEIVVHKHENVLKLPNQAILSRRVDELPAEIREKSPAVEREKTETAVVYRVVDGKAVVTPVRIGETDSSHSIILDGVGLDHNVIVGPYRVLPTLAHNSPVTLDRRAPRANAKGTGNDREGASVSVKMGPSQ